MKPDTLRSRILALSTYGVCWPSQPHTTLVYIWYGTIYVFVGFQCSGAPLRQIPDPGGKRLNFPSTPLTDVERDKPVDFFAWLC